jgi:2,3-dihydroxybiphenyl 1,2-dioxygenase
MSATLRLGYLAFEVRDTARWTRFCRDLLGLPEPVANPDGSRGFRLDQASQRLIVQQGRADDLAALGLECRDDQALDDMVARLRREGVQISAEDESLRRSRRVRRLYRAADPAGNALELFAGAELAAAPFASTGFPGGFRTGDLGIGHAVLVSRDLESMERFYAMLGFGVTERLDTRVGPLHVRGTFLHCNRRHHSLALFDLPLRKRVHHFMLEAKEMRDVGVAFERAERAGLPLSLGLGQHPDPDGTFSFYGATPSGFDFEIGAGGREIEPEGWRALPADVTSSWGHKPRLRVQLKMAAALLADRLGGLLPQGAR